MLLSIDVTEHPPWTVVSVVGDVDLGTVPRLRSRMASLAARPAGRLVLDLSGVDLIDSAGLGMLIGVLRRSRRAGGVLRLVVGPRLADLFALTSLDLVFDLRSSRGEAVEPAAAPGGGPDRA